MRMILCISVKFAIFHIIAFYLLYDRQFMILRGEKY
jgi:hypothetical protein